MVFEIYETARRCSWRSIDAEVDADASKMDLVTSDPTSLFLVSPGSIGSVVVRLGYLPTCVEVPFMSWHKLQYVYWKIESKYV